MYGIKSSTGTHIGFGISGVSSGGGSNTYATFDPSNWREWTILLQPDNLTITGCGGGTFATVRSTIWKSTWKWYFEITCTNTVATMIGIWLSTTTGYSWETIESFWYYSNNGFKYNTQPWTAYWNNFTAWTNVIGVMMDMDSGNLEFTWNGTSQWVAFTGISWTYYFRLSMINTNDYCVANFWETPFSYSVPSGYNAGLYS